MPSRHRSEWDAFDKGWTPEVRQSKLEKLLLDVLSDNAGGVVWKTSTQGKVLVPEMDDNHLINTIRFVDRSPLTRMAYAPSGEKIGWRTTRWWLFILTREAKRRGIESKI